MTRLPRAMKDKLAKSLAKGKIPEHSNPGYNDFFDVFGEFTVAFGEDATDPSVPEHRRLVAALVSTWSAIPADGLVDGVACNQPEELFVAIDAAKRFGLPDAAKWFDAVGACIPPEVRGMDDPGDRHDWYESASGANHAKTLEAMESGLEESDELGDSIMLACMQEVLANPAQYFTS